MNRRNFNSLLGGSAVSLASRAWPQPAPTTIAPITPEKDQPIQWPGGAYRRILVDTHVPDWDPHLLADFDPAAYVRTIAEAGFESVMHYAKSLAGLCLWQSKVGPVHANMKGRDYFGETMQECRRRGLRTVAYYIVIYDTWAFGHFPDWRIMPERGLDRSLTGRGGEVCPNSPYRERVRAELSELVGNYDFDGIFIDMTFWPDVCYCPYCTARFRQEHDAEPPRIVDWDDPTWRTFQRAREDWMLEFAKDVTATIKAVRPITVNHQYSQIFTINWKAGTTLRLRDACDFVGGDFYGGPTQYSLVCKTFGGLTRMRPFEFHTSRTLSLHDFESTKTPNELLTSCCVATLHSAANLIIDIMNPNGTLNPEVYKFLAQQNAQRGPYEPFLGGDMLADVALYFDRESLYDPEEKGIHVADAGRKMPHLAALEGAAQILRQAHSPYGVVTNVNLDKLSDYRAVMIPNVFEMTPEQASLLRSFVEKGGVLYASGPSSLDHAAPASRHFLLEDVFGVRYKGTLGSEWTYLSPQDNALKQAIWPQDAMSFPGPMIHAEALAGAEVLATVTLPFADPQKANSINMRYAQAASNPPALTPGTSPGIVMNSFGKGKALWVAAPIESGDLAASAKVVAALLRRALPQPWHFEVETQPAVEMTLFHQADRRRLLVGLLNLEWRLDHPGFPATVRVLVPNGRSATQVVALPEQKPIPFHRTGPYVKFRIEGIDTLAMALVEYT